MKSRRNPISIGFFIRAVIASALGTAFAEMIPWRKVGVRGSALVVPAALAFYLLIGLLETVAGRLVGKRRRSHGGLNGDGI